VVLDTPLAGICVEGAPGTLLTEEEAIWIGAAAALHADHIPRRLV
jgi:hypothetical protein